MLGHLRQAPAAGAERKTVADLAHTGIFALAERRMAWLDRRASLLAENIANADTPGYKPRDLKPFSAALDQATVVPERTNPMHLPGLLANVAESFARDGETAPDGNAVRIDLELTKLADTQTEQNLVSSLWKSYVGMFHTAIDK